MLCLFFKSLCLLTNRLIHLSLRRIPHLFKLPGFEKTGQRLFTDNVFFASQYVFCHLCMKAGRCNDIYHIDFRILKQPVIVIKHLHDSRLLCKFLCVRRQRCRGFQHHLHPVYFPVCLYMHLCRKASSNHTYHNFFHIQPILLYLLTYSQSLFVPDFVR